MRFACQQSELTACVQPGALSRYQAWMKGQQSPWGHYQHLKSFGYQDLLNFLPGHSSCEPLCLACCVSLSLPTSGSCFSFFSSCLFTEYFPNRRFSSWSWLHNSAILQLFWCPEPWKTDLSQPQNTIKGCLHWFLVFLNQHCHLVVK